MSDYRQQFLELNMCERLSLADAIVLVHHLGLTKADNFISVVDPWSYPHDDAPVSLNHKSYVQSVVAQAAHAGKTLIKFTDASISDFLLSPLLVKKGDRPPLFLKQKAQQSTQSPRTINTAVATVARKPCTPPVNLPIIQGDIFFRMSSSRTSMPHPFHHRPNDIFLLLLLLLLLL